MLDNLRQRLGRSLEDIEDERLQVRLGDLDLVAIADAPTRVPVTVAGEIQGLQVVPGAGSQALEVTIGDGTGRAVAVFTGRTRLHGVDCGRRLVVEGVARADRNRLLILNPAYTIVE